jgi:hypothetical protein
MGVNGRNGHENDFTGKFLYKCPIMNETLQSTGHKIQHNDDPKVNRGQICFRRNRIMYFEDNEIAFGILEHSFHLSQCYLPLFANSMLCRFRWIVSLFNTNTGFMGLMVL